MHHKTIKCVAKAEELLTSPDPDRLRYASLQLRMAIEFLFYELIPTYKEELPLDIVTKWRPQQILDALIECDPDVDKDSTLTVRKELGEGVVSAPVFVGRQKAVNKKLLRKHYHKLGSYLHAPMANTQQDTTKWQGALAKTIDVLREYKSGDMIANFGERAVITCDCGQIFKRKISAIRRQPTVKCPDPSCGAVFEGKFSEPDKCEVKLVQSAFNCPHCGIQNWIGAHFLVNGAQITCAECKETANIRVGYCAEAVDGTLKPLAQ